MYQNTFFTYHLSGRWKDNATGSLLQWVLGVDVPLSKHRKQLSLAGGRAAGAGGGARDVTFPFLPPASGRVALHSAPTRGAPAADSYSMVTVSV